MPDGPIRPTRLDVGDADWGRLSIHRGVAQLWHDFLVGLGGVSRCGGSPTLVAMLVLRKAELVVPLEIHPELWRCPGPDAKPECGIGRDSSPSPDDLGEAMGGNAQFLCQCRCRHVQRRELIGDVLAGVNGRSCLDLRSIDLALT